MIQRVICAALALAGVVAIPAWAQEGGVGAASFFRLGVDARALGMGGAYVSLADSYSAVYWNPAGLARSPSPEVGGTSMNLFGADINFTFLGGVLSPASLGRAMAGLGQDASLLERVGLGASVMEVATEVHAFDPFGQPIGLVLYTERCFSLGIGYAITESGWLGVTAKGYWFQAPKAGVEGKTAWAMGVGVDLGLLFGPWENVQVGIRISDLGDTRIKWHNTPTEPTDLVPTRFCIGAAYKFDDGALASSYEFDREHLEEGTLKVGIEYTMKFLSLRAGYVKPLTANWYLTAGMGIRLNQLSFDAAWLQNRALEAENVSDTFMLSAAFSFPGLFGEQEPETGQD